MRHDSTSALEIVPVLMSEHQDRLQGLRHNPRKTWLLLGSVHHMQGNQMVEQRRSYYRIFYPQKH